MPGRKRAKGYAPWRPQERTMDLVHRANDILDEYRDHLPLTIRQVFYRLVGAHGYPKDENAYERLCNTLNRARRAKLIPFSDLRDDGISVIRPDHYADDEHFLAHVRRLGKNFEADKLAGQGLNMRVLCESAGMMPQLARTARRFSVPVYSCSGFDSLTAKHELSREAHDAFTYEGKQTVVLHLGDLDPSGVSIYESMREDVLSFVSTDVPHRDPEDVIFFERVALESRHIGAHGLTTYPPKASDKRSRRWDGPTCQLEALPPDTLARELAGAMQTFLDPDALAKAREDEVRYYRQVNRALTGAG